MLVLALLLLLLLGVVVGVAALAGVGHVAARATFASVGDRQAHRWRRLTALLAVSSVVGLAVWMSAFVRDPAVLVDGQWTTCAVGIGDDLPSRVAEQCDALSDDRSAQALVAGLTAAAATAIAWWAASTGARAARVTATTSATPHDA